MWYTLLIPLTILIQVAQAQAYCERPTVGENIIMINDLGNQTFLNGTSLTFKCSTGYVPVDLTASKTITCVGNSWTTLELSCKKRSCGPLPDIPNGKYTYPEGNLFGATAIAECNEGYLLVGEKNRNCRENGWDGRDPTCHVVKCQPPPTIQDGTYEPIEESYDYNHAVTYSCSKDYTLVGESSIACLANGTFPPPPQCLLVRCETPDIENAVRVEGKSPPYGYKDFVRYECNKGYKMEGEGYLVCEAHGWNPTPPKCISYCVRPTVGENIIMINDLGNQTFLNGTSLTFKCSTGYVPVDSSASKTITCVGNSWTTLELSCTKRSCGPLPDIPNGKYTYPDGILFGATAVAECNEGYLLVGEKNRNCRENGWDGRHPTCDVVKCEPPPAIQNGTYEPIEESYDYNHAVTYSCSKDYTLVGDSVIRCLANGTFPPPPQCLLVQCETPDIKNAVKVEGKSPPYGYKDFVRYECNKGYKMEGEGYLVCEAHGWNPTPPKCILVKCKPPPAIQHGTYGPMKESYEYNDAVTYSCSYGYTLSGDKAILCSANGTFSSPPKCSIPDSSTTSHPLYSIIIAVLVSIAAILGPNH